MIQVPAELCCCPVAMTASVKRMCEGLGWKVTLWSLIEKPRSQNTYNLHYKKSQPKEYR